MADSSGLLSLLSHELRSPLGVIRGYLRLLDQQGEALSESHRAAIGKALTASERAAELLSQASTLAQLQKNETTLELKPAALGTLLKAAAGGVRLPEDPRVTLEIIDSADVLVDADPGLLAGALTALTSAVSRAQAAETTLQIATTRETLHGRDGVSIGIAPIAANPLHARELDITRGGLGLDLPIAAAIVEAHHGRVQELRDGDRYAGVVVWMPLSNPG
jgi:signal transduction histidine kinase